MAKVVRIVPELVQRASALDCPAWLALVRAASARHRAGIAIVQLPCVTHRYGLAHSVLKRPASWTLWFAMMLAPRRKLALR
jgi:hypothetical protein